MVFGILEMRLIMFFTERLVETLQDWVRAYRLVSLQDAINWTKDMIYIVPKARTPVPPRPTFLHKIKDIIPPQKECMGQGQLDDDIRKLWFTCQEPWALDHRCTKGKFHYIEVFSDSVPEDGNDLETNGGDCWPQTMGGGPPPPSRGGPHLPTWGFIA